MSPTSAVVLGKTPAQFLVLVVGQKPNYDSWHHAVGIEVRVQHAPKANLCLGNPWSALVLALGRGQGEVGGSLGPRT